MIVFSQRSDKVCLHATNPVALKDLCLGHFVGHQYFNTYFAPLIITLGVRNPQIRHIVFFLILLSERKTQGGHLNLLYTRVSIRQVQN